MVIRFFRLIVAGATHILHESQSFAELADPSISFVDKTAYLADLTSSRKSVFLARPRKWGKSVTVNTLACFFQNQRDLFKVRNVCVCARVCVPVCVCVWLGFDFALRFLVSCPSF